MARRGYFTLGAMAVVLATVLVPPGVSQGESRRGELSEAASDQAEALAIAATAVASKFSDYVGADLAPDHGSLDVYLSGSDPAELRQITAAAAGLEVNFHTVKYSGEQLHAIQTKVTQDLPYWGSRGVKGALYGPNEKTGKLDIYVKDLSPAIAAAIEQRYGADKVDVFAAGPNEILYPAASRQADTAPWNGGDFIIEPRNPYYISQCTSGPPVYSPGTGFDYLITAGHCFPNGIKIYNGWYDPKYAENQVIHGSNAYMGVTQYSDFNSAAANFLDAVFVKVPLGASTLDWRTNTTSARQVSGTARLPGGVQVCSSGAYEGEICDITTYGEPYNGYCYWPLHAPRFGEDFEYKACQLVRAASTPGRIVVGAGDSGGPVYRVTPQGLDIVGIITAGATPTPCTNLAAGATRQCFDTLYYTAIGPILSTNSVKLKLG